MRRPDFVHVGGEAEAGLFGDADFAVDDLVVVVAEVLPVLPDPVGVERGDLAGAGGGRLAEDGERDVEVVVRMASPGETPVVEDLSHSYAARHCPEMGVGQHDID